MTTILDTLKNTADEEKAATALAAFARENPEALETIKQATRQGWLKFYPLDKDKPASTVPEFESAGDQISRIINDLKRKKGVIE